MCIRNEMYKIGITSVQVDLELLRPISEKCFIVICFKCNLYGFVILVNQLLSSELSLNIEDSDLYASDKQALSRLHKSFLPLFATSEYVLRMPEPYLIFCGIK